MNVILEATGIEKTKSFPDKKGTRHPKKVLDGVDMVVHQGEIFVILGPTGSGKTTLLRMLNKLELPDSGRILFKGRNFDDWDVLELRKRIGMVFQTPALLESYVEDDILFGAKLRGSVEKSKARELASRVGLSDHLLSRKTEELSLGERQKVAMARALANEPDMLLLDEPSSAQDPSSKSGMESLMKRSVASGLTVVLVTHDVAQAERLADRVLLIMAGKKVLEGPKEFVFKGDIPEIARRFIDGSLEAHES